MPLNKSALLLLGLSFCFLASCSTPQTAGHDEVTVL